MQACFLLRWLVQRLDEAESRELGRVRVSNGRFYTPSAKQVVKAAAMAGERESGAVKAELC